MPEDNDIIYWFLDVNGEIVFSNVAVDPGYMPMLLAREDKGVGTVEHKTFRFQRFSVEKGVVIVLTFSKTLVDSSRIFNEKALIYKGFLSTIFEIKNRIIDDALHDLTKIHGHNIQEIHNVIPEELMSRPFEKQIASIKDEIVNHLDDTSIALIQIIRNNRIMNAEFENIRLIHGGEVLKDSRLHKVDLIIQSIFYLYDQDFQGKKIRVVNEESQERISLDYNIFVGALMPIFENILKYSRSDSQLKISYINENKKFTIRFKMHSLKFSLDEELNLFTKNYSGELARTVGKAGKGLGMYHAKRLLEINDAKLRLYFLPEAQEQGNFRDNILDIVFDK